MASETPNNSPPMLSVSFVDKFWILSNHAVTNLLS